MITIRFTAFHLLALVAFFAAAAVLPFASDSASAQGPGRNPRALASSPLGTGFTYQGQLKNAGALVNGTCTLAFRLYDDVSGGSQIGSPITQTIAITSSLFTTQLNTSNEFGATAFNGDARWLEIRVSNTCPSAGTFTTMSPREPMTPAPYALTAMKTAYKNALVVAKQGGHYDTISGALNSITNNSATNQYLIWVAPGTYTETVTMKQYVDIEGAGEFATKITQVGSGSSATGTVKGTDNAELRYLTAENTGGASYAIAIYNSSASPRLTHVTANASGGTLSNIGVRNNSSASTTMTHIIATASGGTGAWGVRNDSSSPKMQDVTAIGSGGTNSMGVYNFSSSPTMQNVTAIGMGGTGDNLGVYNNTSSSPTMQNVTATGSGGTNSYGIYNFESSPTILNSLLSASGGTSNYGIFNDAISGAYTVTVNNSHVTGSANSILNDTEFTTLVGASKLSGGAVNVNGGTVKCAGAYSATYLFSANLCPNFQSATATLGNSSTGSVTNIYTVTFPSAFSSTPHVLASVRNDYPSFDADDTFAVSVRRVFTNTFVVNIKRVDSTGNWSQSLKLDWIAWE